MTDAERAAAQAILAEKVKDCEMRHREIERGYEERICELEAENARLKKQCAHLANDVIAAAQDYGAPMSDCRSCEYDRYCERKPGQIEPNWDMCEAAVLKSCEPENYE